MYPYDMNMNMNMNPCFSKPGRNIEWTNGMEGAKAFTLKPKESIVLMDSEADDVFYIKFCDEIGRSTLKRCVYHEEPEHMPIQINPSEYVKKSEIKAEVETILNQMLGGGKNEQAISAT